MSLRRRAKPFVLSGLLVLGTLGGLVTATAPANASTPYLGPIATDPYSVSLYSFFDCQQIEVLAGPGLPAFNYQLGAPGGWVEIQKVAPNGTVVDSGGAQPSAIPNYVYWSDGEADLTSRFGGGHGEYVAFITDNAGNYWASNDIFC